MFVKWSWRPPRPIKLSVSPEASLLNEERINSNFHKSIKFFDDTIDCYSRRQNSRTMFKFLLTIACLGCILIAPISSSQTSGFEPASMMTTSQRTVSNSISGVTRSSDATTTDPLSLKQSHYQQPTTTTPAGSHRSQSHQDASKSVRSTTSVGQQHQVSSSRQLATRASEAAAAALLPSRSSKQSSHSSDPLEACYLANNRASESLTISESTPIGSVVGELMVSIFLNSVSTSVK